VSKRNLPKVVTANDLIEGDAVWRRPDGGWTRSLTEAEVLPDPETAEARLAQALAEPDRVVGAYLADVQCGPGGPRSAHFREAFRTRGPSNYPHGKQAGE